MKQGHFLKHDKFLDVCFEILHVFDYGHGMVVKGRWWNQGFEASYCIHTRVVKLNIAKESKNIKLGRTTSIDQWYATAPATCLRNSKWYILDSFC